MDPEPSSQPGLRGRNLAITLWDRWNRGECPDVVEFLAGAQHLEAMDYFEVLRVDLDRRWNRGYRPTVESYIEKFPILLNDSAAVIGLILDEFVIRYDCGEVVDSAEFITRFPHYRDEISRQLAVDAALRQLSMDGTQPTISSAGDGRAIHSADIHMTNTHPAMIGRFRIDRVLGAGAFGKVFLAFDPHIDRPVAMKVPRLDGETTREDFEQILTEARAAGSLKHPNICTVYEVGHSDGQAFIVMAYVDGCTLADVSASDPGMTPERAVELVQRLALTLEYAHQHGVTHRDLKPSNILIDQKTGEPVIADFGLARRFTSDEVPRSLSTRIVGTPGYMSPEQARGQQKMIGPHSDIYSLGVILYVLLTGQRPFRGTPGEILAQVQRDEPERPGTVNPNVPRVLDRICRKAMAKEIHSRFSSMQEFADALERYQSTPEPRRSFMSGSKDLLKWSIPAMLLAVVLFMVQPPTQYPTDLTGNESHNVTLVPSSATSTTSEQEDNNLPSEWHELLDRINLGAHRISGNWRRIDDAYGVSHDGFARLAVPIIPTGSYDLEVECTRRAGQKEVNIIFPVAGTSCMLSLGQHVTWCGFQKINGRDYGEEFADRFTNGQRHKIKLGVTVHDSTAELIVSLDDQELLTWAGPLNQLSLREVWRIHGNSLGLGAHEDSVEFHRVRVRPRSGTLQKPKLLERGSIIENRTPTDVLSLVNLADCRVAGAWNKSSNALITTGGGFSRVAIPVCPEGSYRFRFSFTQGNTQGESVAVVPVGNSSLLVYFGRNGQECGLEHVPEGTYQRRIPWPIASGSEHEVDVLVTRKGSHTRISVQLDSENVILWEGPQDAIRMREDWRIHPSSLGIGAHDCHVVFRSASFESISGQSYLLK